MALADQFYYQKYLKYKIKYFSLLAEIMNQKYSDKQPEMVGGDGIIKLSSKEFVVNRSNSIIVPKNPRKMLLEIGPNEFHLVLSSKYVSQADGEVIHRKLKELNYVMEPGENSIRFVNNGRHYLITFIVDRRKEKYKSLLGTLEKKRNTSMHIWDLPLMDSLSVTKEHHYGTLIRLTIAIFQSFRSNSQYYLVGGQNWDRDFAGKSIIVFEYEGDTLDDIENNLGYLKGSICVYDYQQKKYRWTKNYIRLSGKTFVMGGGDDPIHLIFEWNPLFRVPNIPDVHHPLVGKDFLPKGFLRRISN